MLARLSEMVCRRLREQQMPARTLQLKLRTSDFHTITRARTVPQPTTVDSEVFAVIRELFRENWNGEAVRLLGVHASHFDGESEQLSLSGAGAHDKWNQALSAADRLREKFGENAVSLAAGMKARFREKTHDNPGEHAGQEAEGGVAADSCSADASGLIIASAASADEVLLEFRLSLLKRCRPASEEQILRYARDDKSRFE